MGKLPPQAAQLALELAARIQSERSLGIEFLRLERGDVPAAAIGPATGAGTSSASTPGTAASPAPAAAWNALREQAMACTGCDLARTRKQVVFGDGDPGADLVLVGEAPGRDEDEQGLPFVGRAGQLLTRIIEGGLKRPRASVFICNVLKCRPPGNRDPRPEEVKACTGFLLRQIELIHPKVIVAVGRIAGAFLTGATPVMGKLRGRWWDYRGIPLRVIYHPSYLLRQRNAAGRGNPADRKTLDDLRAIRQRLQE